MVVVRTVVAIVAGWLVGCGVPGPRYTGEDFVGWMERDILLGPLHPDFAAVYDTSLIDPAFVGLIRQVQSGVDVLVFLATWCPDSRREVPRFLKIADLSGFTDRQIRFYHLDRTKKSADGLTDRYRIERVPTFIFLRNGVEIGRVVEIPRSTLEGDILSILAAAQR